jgi:hypothetical protein
LFPLGFGSIKFRFLNLPSLLVSHSHEGIDNDEQGQAEQFFFHNMASLMVSCQKQAVIGKPGAG